MTLRTLALASVAALPLLAAFPEGPAAKRSAPPVVKPLTWKGVTYAVVAGRNEKEFRVYVTSTAARTGERLNRRFLYRVVYDPAFERDIQEYFPVRMRAGRDAIYLTDEHRRTHRIPFSRLPSRKTAPAKKK